MSAREPRPTAAPRRRRWPWFVAAVVAVTPVLLLGGCVGFVWVTCSTPPPLGPLEERLPPNAHVVGSEDWCGDPPPAYEGTWVNRRSWCVRTLSVRSDEVDAATLAGELRERFADFTGNYESVDLGFRIQPEQDLTGAASDVVVIIQARTC